MKDHKIAELVNSVTKAVKRVCPNVPQFLREVISKELIVLKGVDQHQVERFMENELAKQILTWWEDEQFAEDFPGHNKYDEDPKFVVTAKEILPNFRI